MSDGPRVREYSAWEICRRFHNGAIERITPEDVPGIGLVHVAPAFCPVCGERLDEGTQRLVEVFDTEEHRKYHVFKPISEKLR